MSCARWVYYYTFEKRVFDFLDLSCDETWALKGAKNDESASEAMIIWYTEKKREKKRKEKRYSRV